MNILIFGKFEFFFKASEEPGRNYWYNEFLSLLKVISVQINRLVAINELISNAKTLANAFRTPKFAIFTLTARIRTMRDQSATSKIVMIKMVDVFSYVTIHLKVSRSGQCLGLYIDLLTQSMQQFSRASTQSKMQYIDSSKM